MSYDEPAALLDTDRDEPMQALVAVSGSVALPGRPTRLALELPETLSEDEWRDIGRRLRQAEQSVQWWIGDWWAYGERRYGMRKRLVDGWDGPKFQTCMNAARVSRAFETSRRREVVPWSVHDELAGVKDVDERYRLLERAEQEGWTQRRARFEVGKPNANIVKPSDNWNFSQIVYPKLPWNTDKDGYIPGEVYANILFYWSQPGDVVVAPMAGSGMLLHVYDDRARWMGSEPWDLDLRAFDLTTRGPYADEGRIRQGDALVGIEGPADLIIADIPYFGQCRDAYPAHPSNLADMDLPAYRDALPRLAASCRRAQPNGGRSVIVTAASYADIKARRRVRLDRLVTAAFEAVGYTEIDSAYATRRIQQRQDLDQARLNNDARRARTMQSDMAVVLCFEATDPPDEPLAWRPNPRPGR
jgi:hypothetical protein